MSGFRVLGRQEGDFDGHLMRVGSRSTSGDARPCRSQLILDGVNHTGHLDPMSGMARLRSGPDLHGRIRLVAGVVEGCGWARTR
jgi:hypothetical protein